MFIVGLGSGSYSDDLNSRVSRHSGDCNVPAQNSSTASFRSFRPFRRRNPPVISNIPVSGEYVAVNSATPEVTSESSIVPFSPMHSTAAKLSPKFTASPSLSTGSRLFVGCQNKTNSFYPLSTAYSPHRRRCTLNTGLTSEMRINCEFQQHSSVVDSAFDSMVTKANHVIELINDLKATCGEGCDRINVAAPLSALINLQTIVVGFVEVSKPLI